MTTNQTIDGVPRELLESAWEISVDTWSRAEELRAMLDAPIPFPGYPPVPEDLKLPAAKPRVEPVAWSYCPECGSEEIRHQEGDHKQCAECHQEWFSDIDYTGVVRGHLKKLKSEQPAPVAITLNQVLAAYDYANSHPHKYLRGTSNWCAAVAHKLNACLDEVTRLNPR